MSIGEKYQSLKSDSIFTLESYTKYYAYLKNIVTDKCISVGMSNFKTQYKKI